MFFFFFFFFFQAEDGIRDGRVTGVQTYALPISLGSAFALFLYPHATTATLSADGPQTIRRNAVWLPAYSVMLGLVALLGYMALAAHVDVKDGSMAVPALINASFPPWFAGF